MQNSSGVLMGGFIFERIGCYAGGFIMDVSVNDNGDMITRGDVMMAHYRNASDTQWKKLVRPGDNISAATFQSSLFGQGTGNGAWACARHPTNSNIMATHEMGKIMLTTDGGTTVSITSYTQNSTLDANDQSWRTDGNSRMAFDPASTVANGLTFGVITNNGLEYTQNGGTTWTTSASVLAPTGGVYGTLLFDRSSTVVGGRTQIVYAMIHGRGIYRSTTGISGAFSLIASSPTALGVTKIDSTGKLHVCESHYGTVGQYRTWTNAGGWVSPAGVTGLTMAIDPANANNVFLQTGGRSFAYSTNGGTSFGASNSNYSLGGNEVIWRTTTNWTGNGLQLEWDPVSRDLIGTDGFGLYRISSMPTDGSSSFTMKEFSLGTNLIILMSMNVMPNGDLISTAQDHHWMRASRSAVTSPYVHSEGLEWEVATGGNALAPNGNGGSNVDYFQNNQSCWMIPDQANFGANGQRIWLTQNSGPPWQRVTPPSGLSYGGGNIACGFDGTKYIVVYIPSNDQYPRYVTANSIAALASVQASDWQPLNLNATYTTTVQLPQNITIAGGGTGYTVNDVLTVSGGTAVNAATMTVTSVSGGVITGITQTNAGAYSVAPSSPFSVTGGTGTGATFNATFATTGWHHATYVTRRCIVSDKQNDGTFYLFCDGDGTGSAYDVAMRGVWQVSFSGGVPTYTRLKNSVITSWPYDFWSGKFRVNPLNTSHQFWCIGDSSPINSAATGKQLQFTPDKWATQSVVGPSGTGAGTFTEVYDFCFGAPVPGKTYPTIYAAGWKLGTPDVFGIYWCRDFNPASPTSATWELIAQFPGNTTYPMTCMDASMARFGEVYMGFGQEGGLKMSYAKTFSVT